MGTLYDTLGVSKDSSREQIRKAYHALAYQLHPDRHPGEDNEEFGRRMAEISEAYEVLSNSKTRLEYDQILNNVNNPFTRSSTGSPGVRQPASNECMMCASTPAINITLRAEQGFIIWRRRSTLSGTFCQECGIGVFRMMQNRTLIQGWWGIFSFFFNIGSVLANLHARSTLHGLEPPTQSSEPTTAPFPFPAPRGRSLFARSGIWISVIAVVIAISIATTPNSTANQSGSSSSSGSSGNTGTVSIAVGSCITSSNKQITGIVKCLIPHEGKIIAIVSSQSGCPPNSTNYFKEQSSDPNPGRVVCIDMSQ